LVGLAFSNFAYSYWTFPFVLVFVTSLIGFSFNERTHYTRVLELVLIALGVGIGVAFSGLFEANLLTLLTVPVLVLAFAALLYKVVKSIRLKSQLFGQAFLNLALIVLLIGVFISAGAKTTITVNDVKLNTPTNAIQMKIELSNMIVSNSSTRVYNEQVDIVIPECSTVQADVTIQQMGRTYDGDLIISFYPNYGLVVKPLIISTEMGDIYLHFEYSDSLYDALTQEYLGNSTVPDTVSVTVQNSPMIYLVWTGVTLMLIGISVQFVSDLAPQKQQFK
jgi:cytochrome c biogenesis factor